MLNFPVEIVAGKAVVTATLDVERSQIEPGKWVAALLEQVVGHFLGDELREETVKFNTEFHDAERIGLGG